MYQALTIVDALPFGRTTFAKAAAAARSSAKRVLDVLLSAVLILLLAPLLVLIALAIKLDRKSVV